tara:strand:- start:3652 stop:4683 length:1032 start_codon:yes stop_codon:yes gene_type:complete
MKVLLTGDRGYVGSVLSKILVDKGYEVKGYDSGLFEKNFLKKPFDNYETITKDIRELNQDDLKDIDAVIHLAGLSNDPLGELSPHLTEEINFKSTINLVNLSKESGVKRFIYASSQSMYGISDTKDELDEDDSEKNPVSSYAIAKWKAEQKINTLSNNDFTITSFRPSTVFGASPRLRCDIVFNNLVACAYTTGKIEIKSDGSPWRPVVHVQDVCSAFIAGLEAPKEKVEGRSFNVGIENGNFTVKELAIAAQNAVPGSELTFTNEHGEDSRTYKVSFNRILEELSDFYKPSWNLDMGGKELVNFFREVNFTEEDFRGRKCTRLKQLQFLQDNDLIDSDLNII